MVSADLENVCRRSQSWCATVHAVPPDHTVPCRSSSLDVRCRAREDVRGDLMRARHRTSKLLLRQGTVWSGGTAWTVAHHDWLRRQTFSQSALTIAHDSALETVLLSAERRDRLDKAIVKMAADPACSAIVTRLGCLRGVSTLTAFGLTVEVGTGRGSPARASGRFWVWCRPSTPAAAAAAKARSPRPGTPTPAGYWWRPPGSTGGPTGPRRRHCGRVGTRPRPRLGPAGTPATSGCTNAGRSSLTARNGPWSRTSRSPGSSPAGAGPWPCWTTPARHAGRRRGPG